MSATPETGQLKPLPKSRFAKWRALSLSLVYLVFGIHIAHWKLTGKTLAPLELNEVMYTLELGIITAGFLFMCTLVLGTLVCGRFFCSWACHIMVLQDLCAWILRKLHLARKPIRSRVLLWVPAITALYMFAWPQVVRAWRGRSLPTFHWASDREGWASLITSHFWRNLPGPWIIALTFLVCGFAIVYLLGTRTFCTYVCPYGALFALADRFAPARIRVDQQRCRQCGSCTAVCTSGVRVHEEVKLHGMVVNSACLKDLDCVGRCPQQALHYSLGTPALWRSRRSGGRFGRVPYDFSGAEELLLAGVFLIVVFSFRGLYSRVPFLLSLALGVVIAILSATALRLLRRPRVTFASVTLKRDRRLSAAGWVFGGSALLVAGFIAHSAFVRYHEYRGLTLTRRVLYGDAGAASDAMVARTYAHLAAARDWGILENPNVQRGLLAIATRLRDFDGAVDAARNLLERFPRDVGVRLQLARCLLLENHFDEAEHRFREVVNAGGASSDAPMHLLEAHQGLAAIAVARRDFPTVVAQLTSALAIDPTNGSIYAHLGGALAETGRFEEALAHFTRAVELSPALAPAHYNRGIMLSRLGRQSESIAAFERAITLAPRDADMRNNLGFALMQQGETARARTQFEQAVTIQPDHADAHFNLGRLCAFAGDAQQAAEHLSRAAALDPRYAELLGLDPPENSIEESP